MTKINKPKEWWLSMAERGGDAAVGIGRSQKPSLSDANKARAAKLLDAYSSFPPQHLASIIAFELDEAEKRGNTRISGHMEPSVWDARLAEALLAENGTPRSPDEPDYVPSKLNETVFSLLDDAGVSQKTIDAMLVLLDAWEADQAVREAERRASGELP